MAIEAGNTADLNETNKLQPTKAERKANEAMTEKVKLLDSLPIIQHIKEGKTVTRIELFAMHGQKHFLILPSFATVQDGEYVICDAGNTINIVIADKKSEFKLGKTDEMLREQSSNLIDCTTCYPTRSIVKFEEIKSDSSMYEMVKKVVNDFYTD